MTSVSDKGDKQIEVWSQEIWLVSALDLKPSCLSFWAEKSKLSWFSKIAIGKQESLTKIIL
jgi:hypothetical protein